MTSQKLGLLIGSVFGLVFVEVNSGALATGLGTVLRVLGVLAFLLVLVGIRRLRSGQTEQVGRPGETRQNAAIAFTRGYWLVVAAEVGAIAVGVRLLGGPLDTPDAGVAWVAFVVGVHFLALAVVWAQPIFGWVGGSISLCGVAGLVLAFGDASKAAIAGVGGVLPGALLLGFALWAVLGPSGAARVESSQGAVVGVPE